MAEPAWGCGTNPRLSLPSCLPSVKWTQYLGRFPQGGSESAVKALNKGGHLMTEVRNTAAPHCLWLAKHWPTTICCCHCKDIYTQHTFSTASSLRLSYAKIFVCNKKKTLQVKKNLDRISEEYTLTLPCNVIGIVVVYLLAIRPDRQGLIACLPLASLSCGHLKALAQEAWQNRSIACN